MQENFTILGQGAVLERPTFPVNPLLYRVPGPRLAAIPDCRTIQGMVRLIQETFSNDYLPRNGRNSTIFNNSKNFEPSSEELSPDTTETTRRRESDMKRESLDTSIPLPHFQSGDVEADGQPSKKSKKSGAKGSVAILKESTQLGYVSQDSYPRKSILRESAKLGSKHAVKILQGQLAPTQKSGKKGSISTNYPKVCAS